MREKQSESPELSARFKKIKESFISNDRDDNINTDTYLSEADRFKHIKEQFQEKSNYAKYKVKSDSNIQQRLRSLNKHEYLILEYTKFWGNTKFCHVSNNQDLFSKQCPYTNCKFTCDKQLRSTSDALLFHEADINSELDRDKLFLVELISQERSPDQIYLLWNDEANVVRENLDHIGINWTISYRLDSEVSDCAYGCLYRNKLPNLNANNMLLQTFGRKKNQALWLVSNCQSRRRIQMAIELKKYFTVKIYGSCKLPIEVEAALGISGESFLGQFIFGISQVIGKFYDYGRCDRYSLCEIEEIQKNKFYLSFESKNCSDIYITEKFFRMLRYDLIPVLLQPNREFYEKIAPPNSFIHAQDFDYDPERLGAYLTKVRKYLLTEISGSYNYFCVNLI